ncbi:hypothetical protein CMV_030453 [Castanea mollissima]|uniref:Uncharacterized protein n=1 Tax=Castanea mollissima TaxID=60419 RepID=A0A8J4V6D5_9ROSI|nr:hypothetical protein CMV_030453 [Castanea mollissima]
MPGLRSRLWCYEDALEVLTENKGSKNVRGMMICSPERVKEIPKLPESIRRVEVVKSFSLNSKALSKLLLQFGRTLGLPQNMACSGVRGDILMDSQSSNRLSHQIDLSSWCHPSKITEFRDNFRASQYNLRNFYEDDTGYEYSFFCVVDIFINGYKRTLAKKFFENYRCDHRWFYGASESLLQQEVGNFTQGDRNHVEISCKISCWTSKTGRDIAPSIARLGVHVKCICGLHSSIISHENHDELIQPMGNRISKRIVHQRLRPFLPRGCRFILRRLYHTRCPTRSASGRPILKARKISNKRKRPLVARSSNFL